MFPPSKNTNRRLSMALRKRSASTYPGEAHCRRTCSRGSGSTITARKWVGGPSTARICDLNSVIKPSNSDGRVRLLIRPMHQGVTGELLKGRQRVVGSSDLQGARGDLYRRLDMSLKLIVDTSQHLPHGTINNLVILYRISQGCAVYSQELDVTARNEVAGSRT